MTGRRWLSVAVFAGLLLALGGQSVAQQAQPSEDRAGRQELEKLQQTVQALEDQVKQLRQEISDLKMRMELRRPRPQVIPPER